MLHQQTDCRWMALFVIVGETNEDGTVDSFKLTFVMKGNGNSVVPNVKAWLKAEKAQQRPHRLWYTI